MRIYTQKDVADMLNNAVYESGLSRAAFARKIGVSRAEVSATILCRSLPSRTVLKLLGLAAEKTITYSYFAAGANGKSLAERTSGAGKESGK